MLTTTTIDKKFNTEFDNINYHNRHYFTLPNNDNRQNDRKLSVLEIVIEVEKEIKIVIDIINKMKKMNMHSDKLA